MRKPEIKTKREIFSSDLGMARARFPVSKAAAVRWCREMITGNKAIPYKIEIVWDTPKKYQKKMHGGSDV